MLTYREHIGCRTVRLFPNFPTQFCTYRWMDDLRFYVLFNGQSYQDDRRMIMKGCLQWIPVIAWKDFRFMRDSNPGR